MTATLARKEEATEVSVWSLFRNRWFSTLFLTDMWERFSFYGMQALLFLYAVAPEREGGLGLGAGTAGALFGLYISATFLAGMPGGWLGDRVLGTHRAMLWGAVGIAAGHYCMAIPARSTFYFGLVLLAIGTGLLKPNLAAIFSQIYPGASNSLREAAFSLFYMSIQVSALVGPLVTGLLGEKVHWHLGFGAAAVGMTFGVAQYVVGTRKLDGVGTTPVRPLDPETARRITRRTVAVTAPIALGLGLLAVTGGLTLEKVLAVLGIVLIVAPVLYFRFVLRRPDLSTFQRSRLRGYLWVFVPSVLFWAMYGQLGSTFSLFAREHTDRDVGGFEVPASWFQSAHPLFLLASAPLFAWLWMRLGDKVGAPAKLAAGLVSAGLGFAVLAVAATQGPGVSPGWLLLAFLLMVCGELSFGPVGLSVTAEVSPAGHGSQMMGLFYLGAALGAGVGGQLARLVTVVPLQAYFATIAVVAVLAGLFLGMSARKVMRKLAG